MLPQILAKLKEAEEALNEAKELIEQLPARKKLSRSFLDRVMSKTEGIHSTCDSLNGDLLDRAVKQLN